MSTVSFKLILTVLNRSQILYNDSMFVGFTGPARSGKNLAAQYLNVLLPHYQCAAFADALKAMLKVGLGLTEPQVNGYHKEILDDEICATPRYLMQTLGTEWGRECVSKDLWVRAFLKKFRGQDVIITDVRFNNEADMIRGQGGQIIHLRGRGGLYDNSHTSEAGISLTGSDVVIENTGDNQDLEDAILNVYHMLF